MLKIDSKENIQKFAVGIANYTLVDGLFCDVDIPIEDKRKVFIYMVDKLGYFFEEYFKEGNHLLTPFGENIGWWMGYGTQWDMFDIKGVREELRDSWFTGRDIRYTPLTKRKKNFCKLF